jgi:subtilisin family serine protease
VIAGRVIGLGAALALGLPGGTLAAEERPAHAPSPAPAGAPLARGVIVVWEPGVAAAARSATREQADAAFVRTLGDARFQLLRVEPGRAVGDALAELRADADVRSAEPDRLDVLHATTNDPLFGQLWGLQNTGAGVSGFIGAVAGADVDAPGAWDRTRGAPGVTIAVLDSGYRFDAPDLGPVAWSNPADPANGADDDSNGIVDDWRGADFVGSDADAPATDGDPTDDNLIDGGHGVHTAGTMAAAGNDGVGISGVAQDVRIMPLRVCAYSPSVEQTRCPTSSQIAAINYAGTKRARVANMSLGGTTFSAAARDAFAANPETLFVVSAGNDGQDNDVTPHYPCNYEPQTSGVPGAIDNVVCVAATDQADRLASFSDWGVTSVDLGAPGTETLSAYPTVETLFADDFEVDDFATRWTATGADGGFARTDEAPLTSFGISDSPGVATPLANTVRESTSAVVSVPAGQGACRLTQTRSVATGGGDTYEYFVLSDGVAAFTSGPIASSGTFSTVPIDELAGTDVQIRVRFTAGATPAADHGVWLDSLRITCNAPLATPPGYAFLAGTSMAAPHVTGAAALLFSLAPSATVADVRRALLTTTDPLADLAGRTTTGGRLDASAALDRLVPPDTAITAGPPAATTSTDAELTFERADSAVAATFECQLDGGGFADCTSPRSVTVASGDHRFEVRAKDVHGNVDPSPASHDWTVTATRPPPAPAPDTQIASGPVASTASPSATFAFAGTGSPGTLTFECRLDGGAWGACASPADLVVAVGAHTFEVRAVNDEGTADPTPAAWAWIVTAPPPLDGGGGGGSGGGGPPVGVAAVVRCVVPALTGRSLRQATSALTAARCRVGKLTRPRARRGHWLPPLVVRASRPGVGAVLAENARVSLMLKAKPGARGRARAKPRRRRR